MKAFFYYIIIGFSLLSVSGCDRPEALDYEHEELDNDPEYTRIRNEENNRVKKLIFEYTKDSDVKNSLNIAFMTDSHIDLGSSPKSNAQNIRDAIDFCNQELLDVSLILHGGDAVTKILSTKEEHKNHLKSFFKLTEKAKMPFLYTKGNHDINALYVPPTKCLTDEDWGEVWFDMAENEYGIVRNIKKDGQKSGYYYYDLEKYKVRIISLDCFDVDYSLTDEKDEVLYRAGTSLYIANEQFNWVVHTALDFDDKKEKDWGVILLTHFYSPSDNAGTTIDPVFSPIFKKFNSMLLAFNQQTVFYEKYIFHQNDFFNLTVSGDWSRYAELEKKPFIICILSGHLHRDKYHNWWGITHIVTANQFCGKEYSDSQIERVSGTRSQNLFDILNIDLKERRLKVFRYGASANLDGKEGNRFLPEGITF